MPVGQRRPCDQKRFPHRERGPSETRRRVIPAVLSIVAGRPNGQSRVTAVLPPEWLPVSMSGPAMSQHRRPFILTHRQAGEARRDNAGGMMIAIASNVGNVSLASGMAARLSAAISSTAIGIVASLRLHQFMTRLDSSLGKRAAHAHLFIQATLSRRPVLHPSTTA